MTDLPAPRSATHRFAWWQAALAVALVVPWLYRVWAIYQDSGLFTVVGIDWALYASQARILASGHPDALYDLGALARNLQDLAVYTRDPAAGLTPGPVPYPPLFAWLFIPFTWPSPPVGFSLWTLLNLAAAVWLAWRAHQVLPGPSAAWMGLVVLSSIPVTMALILGQPAILLACALAEAYLAFRAGRDLRAGVWLAALVLKPQYAILIGPLLLWKRRWTAVGGAVLGGLAVLVASVAVAGVPALLAYPTSIGDVDDFYGATLSIPKLMINWRAAILMVRPTIGAGTGLALTALLGVLTVGVLVLIWRGPWAARGATFPARTSAVLVATLLASYHSNVHGAALLVVPLAAMLAEPSTSRLTRLVALALVFLPTLLLVGGQHFLWRGLVLQAPPDGLATAPLVPVLFFLYLLAVYRDVVRVRRQPPTAEPAGAVEPAGASVP